jgi:hypothetical protein
MNTTMPIPGGSIGLRYRTTTLIQLLLAQGPMARHGYVAGWRRQGGRVLLRLSGQRHADGTGQQGPQEMAAVHAGMVGRMRAKVNRRQSHRRGSPGMGSRPPGLFIGSGTERWVSLADRGQL